MESCRGLGPCSSSGCLSLVCPLDDEELLPLQLLLLLGEEHLELEELFSFGSEFRVGRKSYGAIFDGCRTWIPSYFPSWLFDV